jgi:cytoskeletal protein CcmA (bactofilin family)
MNLFGRQSRSREPEHIETVIGPTANLRGTLRSDGGVRVDGAFEGLIETAGNVVVGDGARVIADISARNVTVAGAVKGNVQATGRLEILATGIVYGDVQVHGIMIDEGGQFHGVSRMRGLDHPALAAPAGHEPAPVPRENGTVDLRLDDDALDVTARPARAAPAGTPDAGTADEFELDLDDLDLDLDMNIEPIIPNSEPEAEAERPGGARRRRAR